MIIQGRTVLGALDIVREAKGTRRALVREFYDVMAGNRLVIECRARVPNPGWGSAPLLDGLEVIPAGR